MTTPSREAEQGLKALQIAVEKALDQKRRPRIIAATHRTLQAEIDARRFREDLFYRLAVAVLNIPPLRAREGDLSLLLDGLLEQINRESQDEPGYSEKTLTVKARNLLLGHSWPGNVR